MIYCKCVHRVPLIMARSLKSQTGLTVSTAFFLYNIKHGAKNCGHLLAEVAELMLSALQVFRVVNDAVLAAVKKIHWHIM